MPEGTASLYFNRRENYTAIGRKATRYFKHALHFQFSKAAAPEVFLAQEAGQVTDRRVILY